MVDTKLTDLYGELRQAMSYTAKLQRELASIPSNDYEQQAGLYWAISDSMIKICRIKDILRGI